MTDKLDTGIRQEQIAQAALALVAQHGLERLSVADVARRVGLVPSAIYRHFKSKDEVIDSVLQLVRDRLLDNVRAVREERPEAIERLRLLVFRHMALIRDNQALPRVVFSEEIYAGHPSRRARMFKAIQTYLGKIAEIVREGQRDGTIRDSLDPATVSVMFLGLIQPAAILWHMSDGKFDVTRHTTKAWQVFREAIAAR